MKFVILGDVSGFLSVHLYMFLGIVYEQALSTKAMRNCVWFVVCSSR